MSSSSQAMWKEAITEYSKELRLPMIRKYLEMHVEGDLSRRGGM